MNTNGGSRAHVYGQPLWLPSSPRVPPPAYRRLRAGDAMNGHLPLPLPRMAAWAPSDLAVRAAGRDVDYETLSARADDLAQRLAGLGVESGDRVALRMANTVDHVALIHALARLEAVLVALHPRLTAPEMAWQVALSNPRVIVTDDDALTSDGTGRAPADGSTGDVLAEGGGASGAPPATAGVDTATGGRRAMGSTGTATGERRAAPIVVGLADLGSVEPRAVALAEGVALAAPQAILFTSGTTGRPKGVVLTWGNQVAAAAGSALRLGALPDDRWLAPLPLCHVGGLAVVVRCALSGGAILLHDRFDAAAVDRALDEDGATLASLVPLMLARVLDVRGERRAPMALRAVLLGGGPAAPALLERARALGFPLAPTYGLTEATSQVATAVPGAFDDARPTAPPLPLTEVRIVDDHGRLAPSGTIGEIVVRGPTVMAGYLDDPAATAAALRDGWLHTGDFGSMDAGGRLAVAARRDDLIISGGENVYPAEVEAVLADHPDVLAACVVGLPDAAWGQRVAAVVEVRAGAAVVADDLEAFVRQQLAGFKVPRQWRLLGEDELPRTPSGKVRRTVAAARLAGDHSSPEAPA